MDFFNKLFNNKKTKLTCPRCLGKGRVDENDIKRLKQELRWLPGSCAYCSGIGLVDSEMISNMPADEAYLTTDLSEIERQKFINKDIDAVQRAEYFNKQTDNFIAQIIYLYFTAKLEINLIADFYLLNDRELFQQEGRYETERKMLVNYINKVIANTQ